MNRNGLTSAEEQVLLRKGTEPPFSGLYSEHHAPGVYACRNCGTDLYRSEDKFASGCGWPSFDDEIPGAVRRRPDADGRRVEILCAACDGHLGHVFAGEGFTAKDTRHCVNSLSLRFKPRLDPGLETAIFAGGCFWGVEYFMQRTAGVVETTCGYTGGHLENPTYELVCAKKSGHAEAVEVVFDPAKVSFADLARLFFEIHDPTQVDRQGPDVGSQYRSAIFYQNEAQRQAAEVLIGELRAKGLKIATELKPAGVFWKAEDYHQDYYGRRAGAPYCHRREERF